MTALPYADGTPAASCGSITGEESERVGLARVALEAALSVPGVVRADSGPLGAYRTSVAGPGPLAGVVCAAAPGGGYAVALRLVAILVPLPALGRRVGDRVRDAARESGLAGSLRSVSVHFADVDVSGGTQ